MESASTLKLLQADSTRKSDGILPRCSPRTSIDAIVLKERVSGLAWRLSRLGLCFPDGYVEDLIKTLVRNNRSLNTNSAAEVLPGLQRLSHLLQDLESSGNERLRTGCGLMITDSVLLGIASSTRVAVGDDVAFLSGMRLPVVLREKKVDRYELLADVEILGTMYGWTISIFRGAGPRIRSRYRNWSIKLV